MMKKTTLLALLLFAFLPLVAWAAGFERDLYFGLNNDPDVASLQSFLKDQVVYQGPVTGNFFTLTRDGVKKFQEREKIEPALGYFGPKTRARTNVLIGAIPVAPAAASKEVQIAAIAAKIKELQAKLKVLQEQFAKESASAAATTTATTTVTIVSDTTPPIFTKRPQVSQAGFIADPPLGAHYPYRVIFDWAVDEAGFIEESISCTPPLKILKPAGRLTEYFPEPRTAYSCIVNVKDLAGNKVTGDLEFKAPSWVGIGGKNETSFPQIATTPLKLGDISIYNGTTTSILFSQIVIDLTDDMNSSLNRGREVFFVLRKGTTTAYDMISRTPFRFNSRSPLETGSPHQSQIGLQYPVIFEPGEERTVGLWIEDFEYVIGGSLKIKFRELLATTSVTPQGGFSFIFSR